MYPATSLLAHLNERSTRSSRRQFSARPSDIARWYGCAGLSLLGGVDADIVTYWEKYLQRQQWNTSRCQKKRPLFLCCSWFKTKKEVRYLSKQFKKVQEASSSLSASAATVNSCAEKQTLYPDDLHLRIDAPMDSEALDQFSQFLIETFGTNGNCPLEGAATIEISPSSAQRDRGDLGETVSCLLPVLLATARKAPNLTVSCNVPSWENEGRSGMTRVFENLTTVLADPERHMADLSLKLYQTVTSDQLDLLWRGLRGHSRMKCLRLELANKPDGDFGGASLGKAVFHGLLSCDCSSTLEYLTIKAKGLSLAVASLVQSDNHEQATSLLLGLLLREFKMLRTVTLDDRSVSVANRQFSPPSDQQGKEAIDISSLTDAIRDHENIQSLTLEIQPLVFNATNLKELFFCTAQQQHALELFNIPNLASLVKRSATSCLGCDDDTATLSTNRALPKTDTLEGNDENAESVRFVCDGSQALRLQKDTTILKEVLSSPHSEITTLDVGHATNGMILALCSGLNQSQGTTLREISISFSPLTSDEIESFFLSLLQSQVCPQLEMLSLDHCALGLSSLRFLAELLLSPKSTSLRYLNLTGNPMLQDASSSPQPNSINSLMSNEELFFTSVLSRNYTLQHVVVNGSVACKREVDFILTRNKFIKRVLELHNVGEKLLSTILQRVGRNTFEHRVDEGAPGAMYFVLLRLHHHIWSM